MRSGVPVALPVTGRAEISVLRNGNLAGSGSSSAGSSPAQGVDMFTPVIMNSDSHFL
jgi:hypothetical protein